MSCGTPAAAPGMLGDPGEWRSGRGHSGPPGRAGSSELPPHTQPVPQIWPEADPGATPAPHLHRGVPEPPPSYVDRAPDRRPILHPPAPSTQLWPQEPTRQPLQGQRQKPWDAAPRSRPHRASQQPLPLSWPEVTEGHLRGAGWAYRLCSGRPGRPEQAAMARTHTVHPKGPSRGSSRATGASAPTQEPTLPLLSRGQLPSDPTAPHTHRPWRPLGARSSPEPGPQGLVWAVQAPPAQRKTVGFLTVTGPGALRSPESQTQSPRPLWS